MLSEISTFTVPTFHRKESFPKSPSFSHLELAQFPARTKGASARLLLLLQRALVVGSELHLCYLHVECWFSWKNFFFFFFFLLFSWTYYDLMQTWVIPFIASYLEGYQYLTNLCKNRTHILCKWDRVGFYHIFSLFVWE